MARTKKNSPEVLDAKRSIILVIRQELESKNIGSYDASVLFRVPVGTIRKIKSDASDLTKFDFDQLFRFSAVLGYDVSIELSQKSEIYPAILFRYANYTDTNNR